MENIPNSHSHPMIPDTEISDEPFTEFVSGQKEHLNKWLENLSIHDNDAEDGGGVTHEESTHNMSSWLESKNCNERLELILTLTNVPEFDRLLSQQLKKRISTLVRFNLDDSGERVKAMKTCISIGLRIISEILNRQTNQQQIIASLWNAVRNRGCQFLGPAIQDEILRLVFLALEGGESLTRKVLILFVMQRLVPHFPYQSSKTAIGHVIQILYRASCFDVTKRDGDSSLMRLKEEFRDYDELRREHDTQIVSIALEAGLRITPEQWSSLLYGDYSHKSEMQSIVDRLHDVRPSFSAMIEKLKRNLQDAEDLTKIGDALVYFEQLAYFQTAIADNEEMCTAETVSVAIDAVNFLCVLLITFLRHHRAQEVLSSSSTATALPANSTGGTFAGTSTGCTSSTDALTNGNSL